MGLWRLGERVEAVAGVAVQGHGTASVGCRHAKERDLRGRGYAPAFNSRTDAGKMFGPDSLRLLWTSCGSYIRIGCRVDAKKFECGLCGLLQFEKNRQTVRIRAVQYIVGSSSSDY